MAIRARESSADSAARFLAARKREPYRAPRRYRGRTTVARVAPRRIALDFAEPTLRAIHRVLCDAMAPPGHRPGGSVGGPDYGGELLNLIVIAEQMVCRALGLPDCDDPPLTDREVR